LGLYEISHKADCNLGSEDDGKVSVSVAAVDCFANEIAGDYAGNKAEITHEHQRLSLDQLIPD
jgi:hypothetical protein